MKLIYRGAEAILYLKGRGRKILVKERIRKSYRIKQLDEKLRKVRTRREVKLLTKAKKIGIDVPSILKVDEKKFRILMEYIEGERLKEFLNRADKKSVKKICFEVGRMIGKMHTHNLIHGDLTTSNMILKDGRIYFIDFGMGFISSRIEDKGVDLNLLYEALRSTHYKILNLCWDNILKGYRLEYKDAEKVLRKVEEIEKRARYVDRKVEREG